MKIDRKQLRQAVTDALAEHKAAHDRAVAAWQTHVEQHAVQWVADHGPQWAEAAKVIARKTKQGKPIEKADLPRGRRYGDPALYEVPSYRVDGLRRPDENYVAPYELAALGKALDVITDDEITHTSLAALGIGRATLRDAIAQLGRNDVKAA